MKVISVLGLKGGSGKTSTAVPLAWEASRTGRTVLLDLDPTLSASQWIESADMESERLSVQRVDVEHIGRAVDEIEARGDVNWLVLDTPPVARDAVIQAAGLADLVLIPVHIGSGDLAQVAQTRELLRLPLKANPALQVLALLNHAGNMPAITRQTRAEVQATGLEVAETEIPYRRTYVIAKGTKPSADWWHFGKLWTEVRSRL